MFGTLVVCLPSTHKGGDVVAKHCGEEKVFKSSEAEQSFICWYSDVSHEVLPVTSGYRWVVTYNLAVDTTQPRPSAGLVKKSDTESPGEVLKRWLADGQALANLKCMYHVLDHEYTEANISLNALKARDLSVVKILQDLSKELPFEVFLALLEKEKEGSCYAEERDYYDSDDYRKWVKDTYGDPEDSEDETHAGGFYEE